MSPAFTIDLLRVVMVVVAVLVAATAGAESWYVKPLALVMVALPLLIVVLDRHWKG